MPPEMTETSRSFGVGDFQAGRRSVRTAAMSALSDLVIVAVADTVFEHACSAGSGAASSPGCVRACEDRQFPIRTNHELVGVGGGRPDAARSKKPSHPRSLGTPRSARSADDGFRSVYGVDYYYCELDEAERIPSGLFM